MYVGFLMWGGQMDAAHATSIARYAAQEASPIRSGPYIHRYLEPCAGSRPYHRSGESLLGVVGKLRKELHAAAHVPIGRCVPVSVQVQFLLEKFPAYYPVCAREFFIKNDLDAFERCWGRGKSR